MQSNIIFYSNKNNNKSCVLNYFYIFKCVKVFKKGT